MGLTTLYSTKVFMEVTVGRTDDSTLGIKTAKLVRADAKGMKEKNADAAMKYDNPETSDSARNQEAIEKGDTEQDSEMKEDSNSKTTMATMQNEKPVRPALRSAVPNTPKPAACRSTFPTHMDWFASEPPRACRSRSCLRWHTSSS